MRIEIPENSFISLIGISSSGKSSFAKKYFNDYEVLSSDYFRTLLTNDENDQSSNSLVFETLYDIAHKRLSRNLLTVLDATNVQRDARKTFIKHAKKEHVLPVAIVINTSLETCIERHKERDDRSFGIGVLRKQYMELNRSISKLKKEGYRYVYVVEESDIDNVEIVRNKLWNNKSDESGPFDIIGDIHGCYDELCLLLKKLGYIIDEYNVTHPNNHQVIFLGDLCDRGPKNVEVLKLVMSMVKSKIAYCVAGNHDSKLNRYLQGKKVNVSHGLDATVNELEKENDTFKLEVQQFLDSLISHYVFDNKNLVVAHAGLIEKYQGKTSGIVREFCLYGDVDGDLDENGKPIRKDWTKDYRGSANVVYGHIASRQVKVSNNTYCIDTGCVYGGKLTALKYPSFEYESVDALDTYYEDELLDIKVDNTILNIDDVLDKRWFETGVYKNVLIDKEYSAKAFETINKYAVDPRWLIYLPPTMSPVETSKEEAYLEHPNEIFDYFKKQRIDKIICEEKHMGSRAVIVVCKDKGVSKERFGIDDNSIGTIYSRTGRPFFLNKKDEQDVLSIINEALTKSNFWNDYNTDWVCIDSEIMPWSLKALELVKTQYAAVGSSATHALSKVSEKLELAKERYNEINELAMNIKNRAQAIEEYKKAYRAYCWEVNSIEDYKIAPFHILATENHVWTDVNHQMHMETIKKYMCDHHPILLATKYEVVDVNDETQVEKVVEWWLNHTENSGEGLVFKPLNFLETVDGRLIQPALKCRGREYLRIIYGPTYTFSEHLTRLKSRGLKKKRALALSEFALGIESLTRFVKRRGLYEVHESVFAVLALESEKVDPRL